MIECLNSQYEVKGKHICFPMSYPSKSLSQFYLWILKNEQQQEKHERIILLTQISKSKTETI